MYFAFEIQATLEQQGFELCSSVSIQVFFFFSSKNTLKRMLELCDSLKKLTVKLGSLEIVKN